MEQAGCWNCLCRYDRECIQVESQSTSEDCICIGYYHRLMTTNGSELTALYIVNSSEVAKGSTERSDDLISLCNESLMKTDRESQNVFKLWNTTR